ANLGGRACEHYNSVQSSREAFSGRAGYSVARKPLIWYQRCFREVFAQGVARQVCRGLRLFPRLRTLPPRLGNRKNPRWRVAAPFPERMAKSPINVPIAFWKDSAKPRRLVSSPTCIPTRIASGACSG